MPSNEYHFVTRWQVEATPEEVFAILDNPVDMARWWPLVYLDVRVIEPGDVHGVGQVVGLLTKGWLPYQIRWSFRVTEKVPPTRIALIAWGDLDGRGEWTINSQGPFVEAKCDWRVRADKPLLRHLSFLFKPVFEANHHWGMSRGEKSLRRELVRRRAPSGQDRSLVPTPIGPASR
jgi:uncharacterized protein YndB with AHSA1/START domain